MTRVNEILPRRIQWPVRLAWSMSWLLTSCQRKWFIWCSHLILLGADSIKRYLLTSNGNPIVEIRRSYDRLISTMGFPLLVGHLYIESGPWYFPTPSQEGSCFVYVFRSWEHILTALIFTIEIQRLNLELENLVQWYLWWKDMSNIMRK